MKKLVALVILVVAGFGIAWQATSALQAEINPPLLVTGPQA